MNTNKQVLILTETVGDLFNCTTSIGHCISSNFKMSRGIAKTFKTKYPRILDLAKTERSVGDIAVLQEGNKFVYNLITKQHYWEKPTYESLECALETLRIHLKT